MGQPLADRIRPAALSEVVGQKHILGPDKALRRIIESGQVPNMVFYGPSGVGKTTVASIIAKNTDRHLVKLNGTTASTADIKEAVQSTGTFEGINGVLLYLDEIQYFNKKQQQTLLECIENGSVTLIASTTENPYFYVYNAILSRSTVFEFKPVEREEVEKAVQRAFSILADDLGQELELEEGVCRHISFACGGDVRKALNAAELCVLACGGDGGPVRVTLESARELTQKSALRYDRAGDEHYDILSAFQKSMRGSDPDAALHYLARGHALCVQAADGMRLRGCGPGLAPDYPYCQGLCGRGHDGGNAGSCPPSFRRGGAGKHSPQVKFCPRRLCSRPGRCKGREHRGHPPAPAEQAL